MPLSIAESGGFVLEFCMSGRKVEINVLQTLGKHSIRTTDEGDKCYPWEVLREKN